jgi:hypothetical protein
MRPKPHRDRGASAAMLAYRTGLSAALCKGWFESPVAKSAEAVKAMFNSDRDDYLVDDNSINIIRSEIETYALAHVKSKSAGTLSKGRTLAGLESAGAVE